MQEILRAHEGMRVFSPRDLELMGCHVAAPRHMGLSWDCHRVDTSQLEEDFAKGPKGPKGYGRFGEFAVWFPGFFGGNIPPWLSSPIEIRSALPCWMISGLQTPLP